MLNPFFSAWIVLSFATLLSCSLDASFSGNGVGTAILVVAFFKARLVLMVFMEVSSAAPALRWTCEAWVLIACTAVVATYWVAPMFSHS